MGSTKGQKGQGCGRDVRAETRGKFSNDWKVFFQWLENFRVAGGAATAGRGRVKEMCAVVHARATRIISPIAAANKSQCTPKTSGALRSFSCKPSFRYLKGRTKRNSMPISNGL